MKSLITGGPVTPLFRAVVLGRYEVTYFRCDETGFIQTQSPHWLEEAYTDAITALDVGLVHRNLAQAELTAEMIERWLPAATRFIDYGGGYGLFTRLMRDRGFPFLHHDPRCTNLFAVGFETDFPRHGDAAVYDLLTAWEVFEHLPDPMATIEPLVQRSEQVLFSTVLVPQDVPREVGDWWYFTPETGQHVSFYTVQALNHIAKRLGVHYYTDDASLHLFTRVPLRRNPFLTRWTARPVKFAVDLCSRFRTGAAPRASLLEHDYRLAIERLKSAQHAAEVAQHTAGVIDDKT